MCARSNGWILLAATATLVMAGCSAPPQGDIDARITTTIDETLEPGPDLPPAPDGGARRLAASTFDGEPQSDFVVNELIVVPADPQELDALLADWGGELLSAIEVVGGPIRFHVRVDTSLVDVSDADDVLSELALGSGALVVSEESALELLVLAAKATAAGVDVDLVWMVSPQTFEDGSQEDGLDAMNLDYMRANSDLGIGVDEAWLALERAGALDDPDRSVDLGVIDGGFYDNDDFSPAATHTSFVSGAPGLNAPNPANCGKNNPCPRHGTGSALSMAGLADNGFGSAGPAGPVVGRLVTAHVTLDNATIMNALSYLQSEGVSVINMSYSGRVNARFAWWGIKGFAEFMRDIADSGIILVAAAGNDGMNVDEDERPGHERLIHFPCEFQRVVCVGAMTRVTGRINYSNYGRVNHSVAVYSDGTVDLWAPTNILVADSPFGPGDLLTFTGTSAAAPFAAGIFALIIAADPEATLDAVYQTMWSTAQSGSVDQDVGIWPDARAAVLSMLGGSGGVVKIEEPTGGPYDEHDDIPLRAEIDDLDSPASDYSIQWGYEDHAGTFVEIGTSDPGDTTYAQLCDGSYDIEAIASHGPSGASYRSFVPITVLQPSAPPSRCAPSITIVTPDAGAVFPVGSSIAFEAVIEDDDDSTDEPIHSITWKRNLQNSPVIAEDVLSFETSDLPPGSYQIYVEYGAAADSIQIQVIDTTNESPNAVIANPADGVFVNYIDYAHTGAFIELPVGGLIYDPEDGFLSDAEHLWSYREAGTTTWIEAGTGIETSINLPFHSGRKEWQIRLRGTDSEGLTGNDIHRLTMQGPLD